MSPDIFQKSANTILFFLLVLFYSYSDIIVCGSRLREESNVSELKEKLRDKAEKCQELEAELMHMREIVER